MHRNTRRLEMLESRIKQESDVLSDFQKKVIYEAEKLIAGLQPADQVHAKINLYDSQLQQIERQILNTDIGFDR